MTLLTAPCRRTALALALACSAFLSLPLATAQQSGADAAKPKAESAETSGSSGTSGIASNLSSLFGSGFRSLKCEEFSYTPEGQIDVKGRVDLKTTQLALQGNSLHLDPTTKLLTAMGTPVKIQQGDVNAECRKFTYDIEKKRSTLEQNPVVLQKSGDSVTRLSADQIVLDQGTDGKVGIHMKMNPKNPEKLTEIVVTPDTDAKSTDTTKKDDKPQKVTGGNDQVLIKMPGTL